MVTHSVSFQCFIPGFFPYFLMYEHILSKYPLFLHFATSEMRRYLSLSLKNYTVRQKNCTVLFLQ